MYGDECWGLGETSGPVSRRRLTRGRVPRGAQDQRAEHADRRRDPCDFADHPDHADFAFLTGFGGVAEAPSSSSDLGLGRLKVRSRSPQKCPHGESVSFGSDVAWLPLSLKSCFTS